MRSLNSTCALIGARLSFSFSINYSCVFEVDTNRANCAVSHQAINDRESRRFGLFVGSLGLMR